MLRTTWSWPRIPVRAAVVAPASTLRTSWPRRRCGPISRPTLASIWGLIPSRMTSAPSTASTFEATVRMPYSRSRCSRRSGRGWLATTWPGSTSSPRSMPAIIASAMTPEPTVAIVDFARGDIARSIAARSARFRRLTPGAAGSSRRPVRKNRPVVVTRASSKPAAAQRRLELGRLVVDLDDRELAAVVEAADARRRRPASGGRPRSTAGRPASR